MLRRHVLGGAAALVGATTLGRRAGAAEKGEARIVYVEWADALVATNIIAQALKQDGYAVRLTPVSGAAMWQAVASGDADFMVAAWLPSTHAAYYAKLKDQVELVAKNVEGAKLGWAVPEYVKVDSIADLKSHAAEFDNKVIGIDPGAGLMRASEKAMKAYDLSNMTLVEGSDATMTAALKDAISRKQPIVVTGWTPHWMWAAFKLKYLADPKGALGGEETVYTVARKGLEKEKPELYGILKKFKLTLPEEQAVMLENQAKGADPAETAAAWVKANEGQVKGWLA